MPHVQDIYGPPPRAVKQSAARKALAAPKAIPRTQHYSPPRPPRGFNPRAPRINPAQQHGGPLAGLGHIARGVAHGAEALGQQVAVNPVKQTVYAVEGKHAKAQALNRENRAFSEQFGKSMLPQSLVDIAHGHAPSGKHLGEDALFFLPWSRGARALAEGAHAATIAEDSARAADAARAASESYKSGRGIAGGLAGAAKKLTPTERALRASPARNELAQHLFSVHEPHVAHAQLKLFDKSVKAMVRNGTARDVREAVGRLIHVRSHIAPHELPQDLKGLYQHEAIPHPNLPESIDAKGIAKEIHATHGHLLPQSLRKPGALERAINRTYEHVKLGAGYRDWDKRYARVVADTAKSSKLAHVSPRQLAQLMSIYSQRAMPTENFRRALQGALTHGDFQVFGGQASKAKKILEDPNWFEQHYLPSQKGPKVSNYYANALQHLDPQHFAELFHGKPAPVTIDTHMNQMLAGTDRIPPRQYDSLAEVFRHMGQHLGMEPHEVQAASWVSKKAANEAENAALKQAAKGNKSFVQKPASEYLHSAGDAYERAFEKYGPQGEALFQQEQHSLAHDAFNPHVAQVASEANPDPKLWPELRSSYEKLSPTDKVAYGQAMDQAVAGKFERVLGLNHLGNREGLGIWRGKGEHGVASHLLVGPGPITPELRKEMDALTAAQGIAKHQNSVSWGRPVPPSAGDFHGIHWTPPAGTDPVAASAALDQIAGDGNVGFIHAPDGGFYVINFAGDQGSDFAIRRLGGEQTDIGWQGGYTIDKRIATPEDQAAGARTFQDAIDSNPKASQIKAELAKVRAQTEQIQSHFLGTSQARIVSKAEADQLAAAGTHVFHGTSPMRAESIMADRTLQVGGSHPEAAWVTQNPDVADFYSSGLHRQSGPGQVSEDGNIVAIPRERVPGGEGNAKHPLNNYGSPDDILFQSRVSKALDAINEFGHREPWDHELNKPWYDIGPNPQAAGADKLARDAARGVGRLTGRGEPFASASARDRLFSHLDRNLSPDQASLHKELFDNRLKQMIAEGEHPAEAESRLAAMHAGLLQRAGEVVKGAFEPGVHGGIIHLTQAADVTTFPHELGHFLRRYGLNAEHEARLAEWAGVKNGEWTRAAEEKFARGLEKMIRQGDAPNNMVEEFHHLEPLFREVYPEASKLPTVPADVAQVYKEILGHRDGVQSLYWALHNKLVGKQLINEARRGPERTPEEAHAHVLEAERLAQEEGHGRLFTPTIEHKPGEFSPETGGVAGHEVRAGMRDVAKLRNEQEAVREVQRYRKAGDLRDAQQAALSSQHPADALTAAGGARAGILEHSDFKGFENLHGYLDELATHVINFENMKPFDKQNAWDALMNGIQGQVPRKFEQKLLEQLFGKEQESIAAQLKSGTFGEKIANVFNIPRAFMASGDLSAPFRQGLMLLAHDPATFFRNYAPMFKSTFSEAQHQAAQAAIRARDTFALSEKAGVAYTKAGAKISNREEQFASDMAEHLHELPGVRSTPGVKQVAQGASAVVRASDRGYVDFLDTSRADMFETLVHQAAQQGWHLTGPQGEKLTHDIAKFVNSATGRGDLGKLADHAATLNTLFFSPRLLKSRLDFLNPVWYMRMEPFARQQALRSALRLATSISTVLLFAKAAGATVVDDPRNADFGKIRIGDTRLDIAGGFTQPIRLISQLWSGQIISSQTGRVENLTGSGFGSSRLDVTSQFLENKFAPVPGTIVDLLRGSQFGGQPISAGSEIYQHMVPLLWQDMASIYHSTGPKGLAAYGPPDLFGVGVQNYGAPGPKTGQDTSKLQKESLQAGLGKVPPSVQNDVQWKAKLDAATYAGQPADQKAAAAAKLFDERYGTHVSEVLPSLKTEGQAEALYSELRSKLFPSLEHWQGAVDKVLRSQGEAKPTPQSQQPQKSGAGAPPVVNTSDHAAYRTPQAHGVDAAHHTIGMPPELSSAIDRAAAKYGVPAKTLAGIWAIESGRTYPNPAVNKEGYGGLFGTSKWNASTQEQADYAAQTLSHLLKENGGNMAEALSKYSGGGYTSVPGAGGGWTAGGGGQQFGGGGFTAPTVGGVRGQQSKLADYADTVLQSLASGNYNPVKVFTALSSQPLQNTMEMPGGGHIRFQIPKLQGPVGRAARGAIALAEAYLGTPYVWGGESPRGFDCSGLLQYIYEKQGVNIPRTSQEQWNAGRSVPKSQLRPGDAVFFVGSDGSRGAPGHVGIYIGHGKFIEAPHTGATVRISNLAGYPGYVGARRYARTRGRKAA